MLIKMFYSFWTVNSEIKQKRSSDVGISRKSFCLFQMGTNILSRNVSFVSIISPHSTVLFVSG